MRLYFYLRPEGKEEQAMQISVEGAIRAGPMLKAEALLRKHHGVFQEHGGGGCGWNWEGRRAQ